MKKHLAKQYVSSRSEQASTVPFISFGTLALSIAEKYSDKQGGYVLPLSAVFEITTKRHTDELNVKHVGEGFAVINKPYKHNTIISGNIMAVVIYDTEGSN